MAIPSDIEAYTAALRPKVEVYLSCCAPFAGKLTDQGAILSKAFLEVVPKYLALSHLCSAPSRIQSDYQQLFKPLVDSISAISDVASSVNKDDAQFNKLMSVKSASEALNWIMVSPKPASFVKECSDQSLFYANRVRKDGNDDDKAWVKGLLQLLTTLQEYIQEYHPSGLMSRGQTKPVGSSSSADLASLLSQISLGGGSSGGTLASVSARVSMSDATDAYMSEVGTKVDAFVSACAPYGDELAKLAALFSKCAKEEIPKYLNLAESHSAPQQAEYQTVFASLTNALSEIASQAEANPRSAHFNQLMTIKAGSEAFTWILASGRPYDFVKECSDQSLFYANRVRKDGGEQEKEWVKAFLQLMTAMQNYIKEYHASGLMWKGKSKVGASGGAPPPPPPGAGAPPPPPPAAAAPPADASATGGAGDPRAALFSHLNAGENVTKGLKKVTDDMKTHKNTSLRAASTVPASASKPVSGSSGPKPAAAVVKPPRMELEMEKKWVIENYKDETLTVEIASMKQSVYMYNCSGTTLVVKGKVNSISIDNCKKCGVVFDDLLAVVDLVNSKSVQIQALAKMPLLNIDKTDGAQVYLSKDCLDCEIVSAKSSEMNVLVPKDDGDFTEFPIPEQFRTVYNKAKNKLDTSCSESLG